MCVAGSVVTFNCLCATGIHQMLEWKDEFGSQNVWFIRITERKEEGDRRGSLPLPLMTTSGAKTREGKKTSGPWSRSEGTTPALPLPETLPFSRSLTPPPPPPEETRRGSSGKALPSVHSPLLTLRLPLLLSLSPHSLISPLSLFSSRPLFSRPPPHTISPAPPHAWHY